MMEGLLFRVWWRCRRYLLLPVVNNALSVVLCWLGIVAGLFALVISPFTAVGWVLSTVGFATGLAYFADLALRRRITGRPPLLEKDIRPEHFLKLPEFAPETYRFVRPRDGSDREIYPYVDLCQHTPNISAETELTRRERMEIHGRWRRLSPKAFLHLEKRVDGEWRPIAASEILPLSSEGYKAFVHQNRRLQRSLVDLGRGEIRAAIDSKAPILLLNLWVVDPQFRGSGHGKGDGHGGYANALAIRHLGELWATKNRFPRVAFVIESDNEYLLAALKTLTFARTGTSKNNVGLYETTRDTISGAVPAEYQALRLAIREMLAFTIREGTVAPPTDWSRRFAP